MDREQQKQAQARAQAFDQKPRDAALTEHPTLKTAYAVEDQMRSAVAAAKPINPMVEQTINHMIHRDLAAAIRRGIEPHFGPRTQEAVRFQVAYRSMEHVAGEKMRDANRPTTVPEQAKLNLSQEHRELLVRAAESAIGPRAPGAGNLGNDKIQAREIAGTLATLDYPKAANPFAEKSLQEIYSRQLQHRAFVDEKSNRQSGAERDGAKAAAEVAKASDRDR